VDKSAVGRPGQTASVRLNPQNVTLAEVVARTRNSTTLGTLAASLQVHSNDRRTSRVNSKKNTSNLKDIYNAAT
jgi:hypothetical protein